VGDLRSKSAETIAKTTDACSTASSPCSTSRRRDHKGGLGSVTLEKMLMPREHLEFPLWYLKARGWIERLDNGQFAVTIDGIDRVTSQNSTCRMTGC
jgi:hypothetical protein